MLQFQNWAQGQRPRTLGRKILAQVSGQGNTLEATETFELLFLGYTYLSLDWLHEQNVCFLRTWLFSECLSGHSPAQTSLEHPTSSIPFPAIPCSGPVCSQAEQFSTP